MDDRTATQAMIRELEEADRTKSNATVVLKSGVVFEEAPVVGVRQDGMVQLRNAVSIGSVTVISPDEIAAVTTWPPR